MAKDYFETCKDVVSMVDVEALAALPLGGVVGSGSGFVFRQLGKLTVANSPGQHFGIKIPTRWKSEAEIRFTDELAFIGLTLEASPELAANMPSFMALATVEGDDEPAGILTEDVSMGGTKKVRGMRASEQVRELIYAPFCELGSLDLVVSEEECDGSLAFNVNGEEKLLDFTPKPISQSLLYSSVSYREALYKVMDMMPELTINLRRNSVLGSALAQANL